MAVDGDTTSAFAINVIGCVWEGAITDMTSKTTVSDLKLKLSPYSKLTPHQQLLFLAKGDDGQMIALDQSDREMKYYGVNDGDKVWLYSPFIIAKLTIPSLGVSEEAKISDTDDLVIEIKQFVMVKWGVPVNHQTLCCGGILMEDYQCLRDLGFTDDKLEIFVFVRNEGKNGEKMVLFADVKGVGVFEIVVLESFTIDDVQTVIESAANVPVRLQELKFGGVVLKNWQTVKGCGLKHMMTVTVYVCDRSLVPYSIINYRGSGMTLAVYEQACRTVGSVMLLDKKTERPGQELAFYLDGSTKLEWHKYLAHYNLNKESRISLEFVIKLTVALPGGGIRVVDVNPWYTVGQVKKLIEKLCDIQCWMQKLSHMGKEEKEEKIIPDYMTISECETRYAGLSSLRWNKKWSFFFPTYPSSCDDLEKAVDDICSTMLSQKTIRSV